LDTALKNLLHQKAAQYNQVAFIAKDPIVIPHRFTKRQDIEIAGFFAAILAWGNRTSIINSTNKLMAWMDEAPHEFMLRHEESDLKKMLSFAHRTFNATDLLYCISFFKFHYSQYHSLEDAFVPQQKYREPNTEQALIHFHNYFFSLEDFPERTKKHIATPARKSACKRLNMYLRWMVRKDKMGVDFGLWQKINPTQLICPLDVHVANVAHRFGLLPNTNSNWQNALALTEQLKTLNEKDPAVYDYALFGLGAEERFGGL
jgi:uncharacterized protein (TIGR02757 family)